MIGAIRSRPAEEREWLNFPLADYPGMIGNSYAVGRDRQQPELLRPPTRSRCGPLLDAYVSAHSRGKPTKPCSDRTSPVRT